MQCDVLVVGAGPGGSSAAYWLARAGADVLLVDKENFPRDKPCGDGLTSLSIHLLKSMGLDEILKTQGWPYHGVQVYGQGAAPVLGQSRRDEYKQSLRGITLSRYILDEALLRQAIKAGAKFLPHLHVYEPIHEGGVIRGFFVRANSHPEKISAKITIIATGANRHLLRSIGLGFSERPSALAMRMYLDDVENLDNNLEIYLDEDIFPGYTWVFPTGERSANIGAGIKLRGLTLAEGKNRLLGSIDHFLGTPRFKSRQPVSPLQGFPIYNDFPDHPTSINGVLIVGEAAGLVDPLTGEGIALALDSGQIAAQAALEALRSNPDGKQPLGQYDDQLKSKYSRYFLDARELIDRISQPEVLTMMGGMASEDGGRIREVIKTAIIKERPRDSILLINDILRDHGSYSLARSLFTINAYQSWLERCRDYMLAQVALDSPSPLILDLIKRGKMVRALLVFLGCRAAGGDPENVLSGAAGIELVHAASLIHDDIMDEATLRRGIPAVHQSLGNSRAIVSGDYLIAKAFRLLAESRKKNQADRVVDAFIIGAESGISTCNGQFLDVGEWTENDLNEELYTRLIGGKTAAVISGALQAGAVLVGANKTLLRNLSLYGEAVGRAFQIRDDIIEISSYMNSGIVIDRRPSLPLIHAFNHCSPSDREVILRFLSGKEDNAGLAQLLLSTHSVEYANNTALSLVNHAIQFAKDIPLIFDDLEAFSHYVVLRNQ